MNDSRNSLTDNPFGRLLGVLVSPVATFRSIAERPGWVVALVVVALSTIAAQAVVMQKIDPSEIRAEAERRLEARGQEMSDQQLDTMLDVQMKVGAACGALFLPVLVFLGALVFMVLVNLLGGELPYGKALSVLSHAMVPVVLSSLLAMAVAAGTDAIPFSDVQEGRFMASNLAYFAPEEAPLPLVAALSQVDLFVLWSVALLVVGVALVGGLSYGSSAGLVIVLWLLLVGVRAGLAALGGGGG